MRYLKKNLDTTLIARSIIWSSQFLFWAASTLDWELNISMKLLTKDLDHYTKVIRVFSVISGWIYIDIRDGDVGLK